MRKRSNSNDDDVVVAYRHHAPIPNDGSNSRRNSFSYAPSSSSSSSSSVIVVLIVRVVVFVFAFTIGHWSNNGTVSTQWKENNDSNNVVVDSSSSKQQQSSLAFLGNNGWNTIHVFYGNDTIITNTNSSSAQDQQEQRQWYSQVGQDELVVSLLLGNNNKTNNDGRRRDYYYFVDLAANDYRHWSNTYALEQPQQHHMYWNGLCIEPTPRYWYDLIVRRRCRVVGAVIGGNSSSTGSKKDNGSLYTLTSVPWKKRKAYSGIVGRNYDNVGKEGRTYPTKYVIPFESLLDMTTMMQQQQVDVVGTPLSSSSQHHIDYLSLDVEGAEEFVLADLLTNGRYTFSILTIERPSQHLMNMLVEYGGYVYLATLSDWGETLWAHPSIVMEQQQNNHTLQLLKYYQEKFVPWKPESKKKTLE